jgi:hypothetical protein
VTAGVRSPYKTARAAAWYRLHGKPEQAERLEAQLAAAGRCRRCGRTLTDPESVSRGTGRDCESKGEHKQ